MSMLLEKIELEPSEQVILTVRKHWFVIFSELIGSFLMVLVPLFAIIILAVTPTLPSAVVLLADHVALAAYVVTLWILFSLLTGFMIWTHYYLDLWLITDRRIIVIDQVRFFNRKVSSFRLERLQDVKATITESFLPSLTLVPYTHIPPATLKRISLQEVCPTHADCRPSFKKPLMSAYANSPTPTILSINDACITRYPHLQSTTP